MSDSVTVGAALTVPTYVGLAPGIAGVYQINFQVPTNVTGGDQQLVVGRTFGISPFGQCLGSGTGQAFIEFTSRAALLPVNIIE